MAIHVIWDNTERTVLRYDFDVSWTWQELYDAVDTANALMDTVQHDVGSIFNIQRGTTVPNHLLTHTKNLMARRHPRSVVIAAIIQGIYQRSLLHVATMVSSEVAELFVPVASIDEARIMIQERLQAARR